MKKILIGLLLLIPVYSFSQDSLSEKNYRIYSVKEGKEVTINDVVEAMAKNDVLFYGEEHNDSVTHYLERKIFELLYNKYNDKIALSMEMFERDAQVVMNEYLGGYIREKDFKKDARVWSNYRDYRPMVEFAKDNKLNIICSNASMRYTNLAGRKGQKALMELSEESKKWFAPLPYDTASGAFYKKLMDMMGGHSSSAVSDTSKPAPPPMPMMGSFNMVMSMSLWNATMGYSINEYMKKNKGKKVMHVNGRFHSDGGLAVVTELKNYNPKAKVLVISASGLDDDFPNIDWSKYKELGDYIIITDPKVPKTFKD
jgi:uncharacterized iron-regulated protein